MKRFSLTYAIRGYFDIDVDAETLEEAQKKAQEVIYETNFSNIIDPESEYIDVIDIQEVK